MKPMNNEPTSPSGFNQGMEDVSIKQHPCYRGLNLFNIISAAEIEDLNTRAMK